MFTNFSENPKYEISEKLVSGIHSVPCGHTDRQTDTDRQTEGHDKTDS